MTAAYLNRVLRGTGLTITLVESVKLGTIGVGEATVPAIVKFLRELKINEEEFMRQCSATYKLGSKFGDGTPDCHYWHPFGLCGGTINNLDLFHFWFKSVRAGHGQDAYSSYSLQALLAERDQAPRAPRGPSPIMESGAYAYHLDGAAFADLVREIATAEGVNHLFDDVKGVVLGESGLIERVETTSGRTLPADLFIDCSGEVIERGLGDPWLSWSDLLLCDRMVVLPLPRDGRMPPYTRVTALDAGWMLQVPLSHRVGCGYVYSSAHLADDAAARELVARASPARAAAAEPRYLKLRTGRRTNFWLKNCLAVGPAAGSLEPLETTDMLLIQRAVELLIDYFPDQSCNGVLVQAYNRKMTVLHERVRDFLLLHYLLAGLAGEEKRFWRDSKSIAVPESLRTVMELHDEAGIVEAETTTVFPETSYHHLFAGSNRLPRRILPAADALDFTKVCDILGKMKAQNDDWLAKLPPHRELMDTIHRPPV